MSKFTYKNVHMKIIYRNYRLECIISGKRRAYLQTAIDNINQKAVMKINESRK